MDRADKPIPVAAVGWGVDDAARRLGVRDPIVIGSRSSELAMVQTVYVQKLLQEAHSRKTKENEQPLQFEVEAVKTKGDKILEVALSKIGDKGLFTKELEVALLCHRTDIAVHSLKDCPTEQPPDLTIVSIPPRHNHRDAVVMHPKHKGRTMEQLPEGSVVGTSSLRRIAQLKRKFPSFAFEDIRGNLNTRLKKLDDDNKYDCIILAYAGLERLGWKDRIDQVLDVDVCLPAPGQGALGIECRTEDEWVKSLLLEVNDKTTELCVRCERSLLHHLNGGCQVPIAIMCEPQQDNGTNDDGPLTVRLRGRVFSLDGSECAALDTTGVVASRQEAEQLGASAAQKLVELGAKRILDAIPR